MATFFYLRFEFRYRQRRWPGRERRRRGERQRSGQSRQHGAQSNRRAGSRVGHPERRPVRPPERQEPLLDRRGGHSRVRRAGRRRSAARSRCPARHDVRLAAIHCAAECVMETVQLFFNQVDDVDEYIYIFWYRFYYIDIRYREQAGKDAEHVYRHAQLILRERGWPCDLINETDVRLFCKHAAELRLVRGTCLAAELETKQLPGGQDIGQREFTHLSPSFLLFQQLISVYRSTT